MSTVSPSTEKTSNTSLHAARKAKNDEFYTRMEDVQAELAHYKQHFAGKTVYLNCDDPRWSAFWRYFALQFQALGLERLIATHYTGVVAPGTPSFMLEILRGRDEDPVTGQIGIDSGVQTALQGDGDFRSPECVELLEQSDIVVTNPPFSLFREYVAQLVAYDKKFVLIGNKNGLTYKEVWPLIQQNRMWVGVTSMGRDMLFTAPDSQIAFWKKDGREGSQFRVVNGEYFARATACWFTNLDHKRRHEELPLFKKYDPSEYPKYDNYDAINVDSVKLIPRDYDGAMGVPITFLDKWNPDQFEILGASDNGAVPLAMKLSHFKKHNEPYVDGGKVYKRIFVKRLL